MEFAALTTIAGEDWERWRGSNIEVSNDALALATEPKISYTNLRIEAVDISVDRDGNVIVLEESGDIIQQRGETSETELVWENDGTVTEPRAIAAFGDRILLADGASGTLFILSRREGSVVSELPATLGNPLDIIMTDRRIYVLDGGDAETAGRVLTLRRNGLFETVVRGLANPTDMTADSTHLYLIEHPDETPVIRIHDVGHIDSPSIIPTSRTVEQLRDSETDELVFPIRLEMLTDQELVVIGRPADSQELALYHYTLDYEGETLTRRDDFPIRCSKLLTGPQDQDRRYPEYYAIAGEQRYVYIVDERQANRRNPVDGRYSGQAYRRLDAGAPDTSWNRLTLSLDSFPPNTQVVTSFFATNETETAGTVADIEEIPESTSERLIEHDIEGVWDLLDADTEQVASLVDTEPEQVEQWVSAAVERAADAEWRSAGAANQWDILLNNVEGRYLHLKIEFIGGVDASPEIGSLRAYCPKRSYLRYLPQHYTRNTRQSQFLEQYLSMYESELVDIEEDIDTLSSYFDPDGVPNEYLSWLSSWLALDFDDEWPAGAKREFLREAPRLFTLRGTKTGLERTIRLYLAHVEQPDTGWMTTWQKRRVSARRADGALSAEEADARRDEIDETSVGYDDGHLLFVFEHLDFDRIESPAARDSYTIHMDGPRSFVAFVGPFVSQEHGNAVDRIVAAQGPAHTSGTAVEMRHEFKLEGSCFLGINSTLTSREFVLGRSTLGGDTVLKDRPTMLE